MPYITREDGEHFVIPSYRDVLDATQKSALKKEIMMLSQNYGEYITMQRKTPTQYEVAFSPDMGYLLGESIWHHFKRPLEMIYCEAIPNTTEAILVIVKEGSVYLDGSFSLENIPEELVIFLTQQNSFEIYTYGDVPISQTPEEGKFSFEAGSVKSFTVLDKPVFPTLPLLKIYQLQLVDQVLKAQGIGIFPIKPVLVAVVVLGLMWMLWSFIARHRGALPEVITEAISPYQTYVEKLTSPAPDQEFKQLLDHIDLLLLMPGWEPKNIKYTNGSISAAVQSIGSSTQLLFDWAKKNSATIDIKTDGIYVMMTLPVVKRPSPTKIYPLKEVIASFVDRLAKVYPGNNIRLDTMSSKGTYSEVRMTITVREMSPMVLSLIGEQLKDLPFVLQNVTLDVDKGVLSGSIIVEALGS